MNEILLIYDLYICDDEWYSSGGGVGGGQVRKTKAAEFSANYY